MSVTHTSAATAVAYVATAVSAATTTTTAAASASTTTAAPMDSTVTAAAAFTTTYYCYYHHHHGLRPSRIFVLPIYDVVKLVRKLETGGLIGDIGARPLSVQH